MPLERKLHPIIASGLDRPQQPRTSHMYLNLWWNFFCSFFQTIGYLKRGDGDKLKAVFEKYASANVDGVQYMTDEDFVVKFLKLFPESGFNKHSVNLLCGILDQSKDG